jgi:hypothetical protein
MPTAALRCGSGSACWDCSHRWCKGLSRKGKLLPQADGLGYTQSLRFSQEGHQIWPGSPQPKYGRICCGFDGIVTMKRIRENYLMKLYHIYMILQHRKQKKWKIE